jgi:hypothetical protein
LEVEHLALAEPDHVTAVLIGVRFQVERAFQCTVSRVKISGGIPGRSALWKAGGIRSVGGIACAADGGPGDGRRSESSPVVLRSNPVAAVTKAPITAAVVAFSGVASQDQNVLRGEPSSPSRVLARRLSLAFLRAAGVTVAFPNASRQGVVHRFQHSSFPDHVERKS